MRPYFVLLVIAIIVLLWLGYHNDTSRFDAQGSRISSQATQIGVLSTQVNQAVSGVQILKQALSQANSEAVAHGGTAVATPSVHFSLVPGVNGSPGATGASGARGARGAPGHNITLTQARNAVRSFCARNGCAPVLTLGQVAQALATYCDGNGKCRGPKGDTGASGAAAPPLTADQVLTGVSTYCNANDGCRGPTGPTGPQGSQGDPGHEGASGASGQAGEPPFSWTFLVGPIHYTCIRIDTADQPFDPAKPEYDCEPDPLVPVPSSS